MHAWAGQMPPVSYGCKYAFSLGVLLTSPNGIQELATLIKDEFVLARFRWEERKWLIMIYQDFHRAPLNN